MTYLYLIIMIVCVLVGARMLFSYDSKVKKAAVLILILGVGFFVVSVHQAKVDRQTQADAESMKADDVKTEDLIPFEIHDDEETEDAESESDDDESIAESQSIAASESAEAQSQSIAASQEIAASESIAARESAAAASRAREASIANAKQQAAAAQRSGNATQNRSYEYKPVPQTGQAETVYVNASIPGRYHKDPNCRGLQRYGGGTVMTLAQAQGQGYRAFCAYERYQ